MPTRRGFLLGGCSAIVAASVSNPARALPFGLGEPEWAPRARCPHTGCRHHRPEAEGPGLCGLSLFAPPLLDDPAVVEVTP